MIRFYGTAVSNYSNMVKLALLEKGFDFEEVAASPSQDPDFLAKSPMGKVPFIEVDEGFLSETTAIFDFLENCNAELPLYPGGAYHRAKTKEIIKICELYVEAPARRLLGSMLTGRPFDQHLVDEVRPAMAKGLSAMQRVAQFVPYIAGDQFSYADIFVYYSLVTAALIGARAYDWDICAEVGGLSDWRQMIAQRTLVKQVDGVARAAFAKWQNSNPNPA